MFSALSSIGRFLGSAAGRGLSATSRSSSGYMKRAIRRGVSNAGRNVSSFLNNPNTTEEEKQQQISPTDVFFKGLGLASLFGPQGIVVFGVIVAVIIIVPLMFLFISQIVVWPTGLN